MYTHQNHPCQCLCSYSKPQLPSTSRGDPLTLTGKFSCFLWGRCFYPLGPVVHKTLGAPSEVWVPVSPRPVDSCSRSSLAFNASLCGGPPPTARPLGRGAQWGLELSLPWESFCGPVAPQFVGAHTACIGFGLILTAPLLPSPCAFFFVLDTGIVFAGFRCPGGAGDCSAVSSDFGVSIRRGELCCSALPSCLFLAQYLITCW